MSSNESSSKLPRGPPQLIFDDGSRIMTEENDNPFLDDNNNDNGDTIIQNINKNPRGGIPLSIYYEIQRISQEVIKELITVDDTVGSSSETSPKGEGEGEEEEQQQQQPIILRIALQFPDELLEDSPDICWLLEDQLNEDIIAIDTSVETKESHNNNRHTYIPFCFVLGDTTVNSCCPDEVAALHLNADLLIHYGHACLSPTGTLPILYSFGKLEGLSTPQQINQAVHELELGRQKRNTNREVKSNNETDKFLILYQVGYHHAMQELQEQWMNIGNASNEHTNEDNNNKKNSLFVVAAEIPTNSSKSKLRQQGRIQEYQQKRNCNSSNKNKNNNNDNSTTQSSCCQSSSSSLDNTTLAMEAATTTLSSSSSCCQSSLDNKIATTRTTTTTTNDASDNIVGGGCCGKHNNTSSDNNNNNTNSIASPPTATISSCCQSNNSAEEEEKEKEKSRSNSNSNPLSLLPPVIVSAKNDNNDDDDNNDNNNEHDDCSSQSQSTSPAFVIGGLVLPSRLFSSWEDLSDYTIVFIMASPIRDMEYSTEETTTPQQRHYLNSMLCLLSLQSEQQPHGNNDDGNGGDDFSHWVYSPPKSSNSSSNNNNNNNNNNIEEEEEEGNNSKLLSSSSSSILLTDVQPPTSIHRLLKRRFFLTQKAKDSTTFGILVSNLSQQYLVDVVKAIQQLITLDHRGENSSNGNRSSSASASGRSCYSFAVGKINPNKLANFAEIDMFVLVACQEHSLLDKERLEYGATPVITPMELQIALNYKTWGNQVYSLNCQDILQINNDDNKNKTDNNNNDNNTNTKDTFTTFTKTHHDSDAYTTEDCTSSDNDDDDGDAPYFSMVTGKYVSRKKTTSTTADADDANLDLLQLPGAGQMMTYHSEASNFLQRRQYQGLTSQMGQTDVQIATLGLTGIASDYSNTTTNTTNANANTTLSTTDITTTPSTTTTTASTSTTTTTTTSTSTVISSPPTNKKNSSNVETNSTTNTTTELFHNQRHTRMKETETITTKRRETTGDDDDDDDDSSSGSSCFGFATLDLTGVDFD